MTVTTITAAIAGVVAFFAAYKLIIKGVVFAFKALFKIGRFIIRRRSR